MSTHDSQTAKHEGKNVKRMREILGIKQEALAAELGINQQKMSFIEQKEKIDDELMEQIAKALKVPVEAIENFNEEAAVNIISNNSFENCDQPASIFYYSTINPIDKWLEALEENKKLYERLLESEKQKVALLEKLVLEKK
jgi:transcriptional regulator with XRE-family HTH domain